MEDRLCTLRYVDSLNEIKYPQKKVEFKQSTHKLLNPTVQVNLFSGSKEMRYIRN